MNNNNPEDKIILAIDGLSINESMQLIKKCPKIKWVKIGLELFSREGPAAIKIFKDLNKKIFLDLKFHDIPNTMDLLVIRSLRWESILFLYMLLLVIGR